MKFSSVEYKILKKENPNLTVNLQNAWKFKRVKRIILEIHTIFQQRIFDLVRNNFWFLSNEESCVPYSVVQPQCRCQFWPKQAPTLDRPIFKNLPPTPIPLREITRP